MYYNAVCGLCMLDNLGYKHPLGICTTCYFSQATLVTRAHQNVTFIRALPVSFCTATLFTRIYSFGSKHVTVDALRG